MKVIGLSASPRKGNSYSLVEHVLAGAKEAGAEIELIRLSNADINPCKGCNACKGGDSCIQDDGMTEIYQKLMDADAVVFGSPVYFYRLAAQAYPLLDRLFALLNPDFSPRIPAGKKFVLALTCGSAGEEVLNPINAYMKNVFSMFGFKDAGFIWQNTLMAPDELNKFPDKINEAVALGKALVK